MKHPVSQYIVPISSPIPENPDERKFVKAVRNLLNGRRQIIGMIEGASTKRPLHVSK
jgi:hypothetical protein